MEHGHSDRLLPLLETKSHRIHQSSRRLQFSAIVFVSLCNCVEYYIIQVQVRFYIQSLILMDMKSSMIQLPRTASECTISRSARCSKSPGRLGSQISLATCDAAKAKTVVRRFTLADAGKFSNVSYSEFPPKITNHFFILQEPVFIFQGAQPLILGSITRGDLEQRFTRPWIGTGRPPSRQSTRLTKSKRGKSSLNYSLIFLART